MHGSERLELAHSSYALRIEEILRDWPIAAITQATELLNALVEGAAATDADEPTTGS